MATLTGKAVSELPEATTVNDNDLFALSQSGASKKLLYSTLRALFHDGVLNIEDTYSGLAMFNRIGVIGDSFSSGGINPDGTSSMNKENSWVQIIAKKLGITAINYSRNGYETQKFVDSSNQYYSTIGLGAILDDISAGKACGLYIFAMGINDATLINGGTYSIGTLSDIHDEHPEQNAASFYGNVGKIISNIQINSPGSKIIMQTFCRMLKADQSQTIINVNNAIIAIADHFSIPCIDIRDDVFFQSDYYLNNLKHSHPTLDQYVGYANSLMRLYSECIVNNNSYFYNYRNVGIINDSYSYFDGDSISFSNTYAQFFAVATSATELRVFIPLNRPVKARSFSVAGGYILRSTSENAGIQGAVVSSSPSGGDSVIGHQFIAENGVAFGMTFASGTLTQRQVYAFQPSSSNPLVVTFS